MRILVYSSVFFPSVGGVERYVGELAEGLIEKGLDVTVVTRVDDPGRRVFPYPVLRRPSWIELMAAIRRADILHLAGPAIVPMLLARLAGRPFVVEHHNYQPICPNGLLFIYPGQEQCPGFFQQGRIDRCMRCQVRQVGWTRGVWRVIGTPLRRFLTQAASANISITNHVENRLGLRRSKTIYYGLHRVEGETTGEFVRTERSRERICFAYVGRLVSEKGLELIVEAARELRSRGIEFRVIFVGDGDCRSRLESLVRDNQLQEHVAFTGFLSGGALEKVVEEIDVVVMPSRWEETAGLSAIEQMRRARLVIAADIGGLGEIVRGAGLLFHPGSASQLAEAMARACKEPILIDEFGAKALKRSRELFTRDRMVDEQLGIYRCVLERRGRS